MKYMAASIPRYMRTTRLTYLRLSQIIGSKLLHANTPGSMLYDIIMLPDIEFQRMKAYLAAQVGGMASLERGNVHLPYIPLDTKAITVPRNITDKETYARLYFLKAFDLSDYK